MDRQTYRETCYMNKLTAHFSRSEFACKCGCGFDTVDIDLINILEDVRKYFGSPVTINSGCRCSEYNEKIGGEKNSWHMKGRAADIVVEDVEPDKVADYIESITYYNVGLGRYNTFTHVDSRGVKARWDFRTKTQ